MAEGGVTVKKNAHARPTLVRKLVGVVIAALLSLGCAGLVPTPARGVDMTAEEAMQYVRSLVGQSIDFDGVYGAQCVDLTKAYYNHLVGYSVKGNACDYVSNNLPDGWDRIKGGTPQKGDVLIYLQNEYNTSWTGHVAIFESDTVTYHQNYGGPYVQRIERDYRNPYFGAYWGYIRPNFKSSIVRYDVPSSSTTDVPNGTYYIASALDPAKGLDAGFDTSANGANVSLWSLGEGRPSNQWRFERLDDGSFRIFETRSGRVLDVSGGGMANGTNIQLWEWNGTDAQRWYVTQDGSGGYWFTTKLDGRRMDVTNASTANGANIQTYEPNNTEAQAFRLIPVSSSDSVKDGSYVLSYCGNEQRCVGADRDNAGDGSNVSLQTRTGEAHQVVTLTRLSDGSFKIVFANHGNKALDVNAAAKEQRVNVQMWAWNDASAQHWYVVDAGDGWYWLVAKCSGLRLDVEGGGDAAEGTNLYQYGWNNTVAQKFRLVPFVFSEPEPEPEPVPEPVPEPEPTPEPEPSPSAFLDVGESHWARSYVGEAARLGLVQGVGGGLFKPDDPVTRGQVALILWRAAGAPAVRVSSGFSDVPDDAYYAEAVAWGVSEGFINGVGNGRFEPDAPAQREQLAKMVAGFARSVGVDTGGAGRSELELCHDWAQASDWALEDLAWTSENGILGGCRLDDGLWLYPQNGATRAEMAKIVVTMLQVTGLT